MNSPVPPLAVHPLTVEEIEDMAAEFKDGLTGECERMVRRKDNSSALAAIIAKEYIDKFVYRLKLRAGSELGRPNTKEPKKRIRHIYVPDFIAKKPPVRMPISPTEAAERRHVQEVVAAAGDRRQPKHY